MARNMYAKPTTTNASFLKVPVNLSSDVNENLTWGQLAAKLPVLIADGTLPIKAVKLGAITVGGSPDAPAHLEFKGGQTFDLPALANRPMRVKASEKNLYVSGWRRITKDGSTIKVSSNTDDDDLTNSVVFTYRGQVAYIEVALRFEDDTGYRPWYQGDTPPVGDFEIYHVPAGDNVTFNPQNGVIVLKAYRTVLWYPDSSIMVVGEVVTPSDYTQWATALAFAASTWKSQYNFLGQIAEGFTAGVVTDDSGSAFSEFGSTQLLNVPGEGTYLALYPPQT